MDVMCTKCLGMGWVCEVHPDRPWHAELGCKCRMGRPCECNAIDQEEDPQFFEEKITRH